MSGAPKVAFLGSAVILYFGLGVFGPLYGHLPAQALLLAGLMALRLATGGGKGLRGDLVFLLPFVLVLLAMGALLDLCGVPHQESWTQDSLRKALVFPNSFWSVQLAVAAIHLRDIMGLPIPAHWRRLLIVGHAVLSKSRPLVERLWWMVQHDPHLAHASWLARHRRCLTVLLVASLAALYHETEKTLRLYDARRAFLAQTPGYPGESDVPEGERHPTHSRRTP